MLSKKKKVIILVSMLVLLVATGWLNIALNNKANSNADMNTGSDVVAGNFFQTYRTDRLTTRNTTILYLDAIIANEASTVEAVAEATAQKLAITAAMEKELVLEGLIKTREGVEDCVVTMSTENINVIVQCEAMDDQMMSQILSTIRNETNVSAKKIKIIPVE